MGYKHELIGKKAKIEYNSKRFEGIIINETKNTLVVRNRKNITIIKKNAIIRIGKAIIIGESIIKRPEDRIKK